LRLGRRDDRVAPDITNAGGGLLDFSSYEIRHFDSVVGDQLERLFEIRGYLPNDPSHRRP
jgi:hypothetical protein